MKLNLRYHTGKSPFSQVPTAPAVTPTHVRVKRQRLLWRGCMYMERVFAWRGGHHVVITVLYISVNLWIFLKLRQW